MPARLTHYRRLREKAREELRAQMEETIADELRRLFRSLKTRLRMLDRTKVKLQKVDIIELSMWQVFQERLHRRLMKDIREGVINVFTIEMAMAYGVIGQPIVINTDNFAAQHSAELAQMVVNVSESTKRMIAKKVVSWFRTPEKTFGELIAELEPRFGRPRAKLIAQTELTRLNSLTQAEVPEIRYWGEIDSNPTGKRYGHLMGVFRVDQKRAYSEVWYPAEDKWVFDFSVYGKVNGLEDGLSFHEISKEDVERFIERHRVK